MAIPSPSSPASPALSDVLSRLGLTEYLQVLSDNGFHTWAAVLDITEDDMTALSFKLGHRRLLQREIATYRGIPQSLSLDPESNSPEPISLSTSALESFTRQTTTPPPREKRRYRRHPRPDPNAPKKPKTAYVNFADQLRTDPEVSQLSFVDIAREVGRRWQELPAERKRIWERNAARAMQEFEAQMDEYKKTENWQKHQNYLNDFKAQQSAASANKHRPGNSRSTTDTSNNSRPYSQTSPSSVDSPISLMPASPTRPGAEVCHNALTLAMSELNTLRSEIINGSAQCFDHNRLPPEDRVRRCMYAFIRGTGSLLYMWTFPQADEILERIYRPQTKVDNLTLSECFTVAAMGAHYDEDAFPDETRRLLYASGTFHFNEQTARQDNFRTMRLLLSLSFFSLLEKHMSAKYLIAAGLQIARWRYVMPQNRSQVADVGWRKIFRSLIFMDSWLSYTLGYPSEVTASDVQIACVVDWPDHLSIDDMIHTQTSKINLIAAEVAKTLASPELATKANITMLTQKLEQWRQDVPHNLQIPTLLSSEAQELNVFQKRAIFMVHIMYLGALVLLYRQLLVAAASAQLGDETTSALNNNISADDVKLYRRECATAAQNIARMLGLISFDGTLTTRCWIIIYWSFSAAICLLFTATTKLMDGQTEGVEADLAYAKSCMDMLEPCKTSEPVAARYLQTLWPLYDNLQDVLRRMVGRSKSSIFAILQPDPSLLSPPIPVSKQEMGPISEKLTVLLTDPFGRMQKEEGVGRRILSDDGSCLVFWFR